MIWFFVHLALAALCAAIESKYLEPRAIYTWTWDLVAITLARLSIPLFAFVQWLGAPGQVPLAMRTLGILGYLLGALLSALARRDNPYILPEIEVPPEVIKTGVYEYCRHPFYLGQLLVAVSIVAILGQMWAFVPFTAYCIVIAYRAHLENKLIYGSLT